METALKELLKHFPEYEQAAKGKWDNVPVTTRKMLESYNFQSCPVPPIAVRSTSGTTRKNMLVFYSAEAFDAQIRRTIGILETLTITKKERILNLLQARLGTGHHALQLACKEMKVMSIPFCPPGENINPLIALVKALNPTVLCALVGVLSDVVSAAIPLQGFHRIITGGSLATSGFKKLLQEQSHVRLSEVYGCSEVGFIGVKENINDEYFIAATNGLYLEIISGDKISENGRGNLLITDMQNASFPIIRYCVGDEVELIKKDNQTYMKIFGRSDYHTNINQSVVPITLFVQTIGDLLGTERFCIIIDNNEETSSDKIKIKIPSTHSHLIEKIQERVKSILEIGPSILVHVSDRFPRADNGKYIQFIDLRKLKLSNKKLYW